MSFANALPLFASSGLMNSLWHFSDDLLPIQNNNPFPLTLVNRLTKVEMAVFLEISIIL